MKRLLLERLEDRLTPAIGFDPSFNATGKTLTSFGPGADQPVALAVQADDKVVTVATTNATGAFPSLLLSRFNAAGTLDTTFDTDGIVRFDPSPNSFLTPTDVEVQADGKILVLANDVGKFSLLRFTTAGALDTTFDTDGIADLTAPAGTIIAATRLAIQSDGKIVVVGSQTIGTNSDLLVARFTTAGALDITFDTDGVLVSDFGGQEVGNDVAIQSDNKIVIVGTTGNGLFTMSDLIVARLNSADGSFDNTFSADGKVIEAVGGVVLNPRLDLLSDDTAFIGLNLLGLSLVETAYSATDGSKLFAFSLDLGVGAQVDQVFAQADNNVVISASLGTNSLKYVRVAPGGAVDATFGTTGIFTLNFPTAVRATSAGIGQQVSGKLVAAAAVESNTSIDEQVVRITTTGTLDPTFGTNGIVTLPNQGSSVDDGRVVLRQADGKILVIANTSGAAFTTQNLGVARFNADGTVDNTFDGDGKLVLNVGGSFSVADAVLQSDGKILIVGTLGLTTGMVIRLNPGGTFDSTFDTDGKLSLAPVGGTTSTASFVAVQSDGKILVTGQSDGTKSILYRFSSTGAADTTFDTDGQLPVTFNGTGTTVIGDLVVQPDGKILVAGTVGTTDGLMRFNTNGSADTTFDADGLVTVPTTEFAIDAVTVQADGKILFVADKTGMELVVHRLNANGSADVTFAGDGDISLTSTSFFNGRTGLFALADGTVFVVQAAGTDLAIFHLTSAGALDTSYDTDGKATVSLMGATGSPNDFLRGPDGRVLAVGQQANDAALVKIDLGYIPLTVTLDPASDLGNSTTDFITSDTTPTFKGIAVAGATVKLFNGGVLIGTTTANANGEYTITTGLDNGTFTITGTATDANGNSGATLTPVTLTIDGVVPTLTIALMGTPNATTKLATFTFTFSEPVFNFGLEDITLAGTAGGVVTALSGSGTTFLVTVGQLTAGTLTFQIAANSLTDLAGNPNAAISQNVAIVFGGGTQVLGGPNFIVGPGSGGPSTVRMIDGSTGKEISSSNPFGNSFTGGIRVAAGDVNNDGTDDVIAGAGPGISTQVRVIDGKTGNTIYTINPFESSFTGGVFVAVGDIDKDGFDDIVITPDQGGGPRIKIISGKTGLDMRADFFGIEDPNFRGGARASLADVNGDGTLDLLVAAGFGGGPRLAVFSGKSVLSDSGVPVKLFGDFFVFEQTLRNGVFISGGDIDGDGFADVIAGGGPGGGPRVFALSGQDLIGNKQTQVANFFAGDPNNRGGIRITVKNVDGDSRADLITGAGDNAGSQVNVYLGSTITRDNTPPSSQALQGIAGFNNGVFVG